MKPETKRIKELDRQHREKIIQEARKIEYDFKRWGISTQYISAASIQWMGENDTTTGISA